MRIRTLLATVLALAATAVAAPSASALTVYAATSLTNAFPGLDKTPAYSFGGSNTLQAQIERGAPADVFASAEPKEAQALFAEHFCSRPVTFATNTLVLIVPSGNPAHIKSVYSLRAGGFRLSIGNSGVPIGDYTRKLLARLGLSSILRSNTVSEQTNVGQVVSQVSLGAADAGFVYITDAEANTSTTDAIHLPTYAQPPVRYQICAVQRSGADTSGAGSFISEVTGGRGRSVLKHFGFGLPPRAKK